MAQTLLFQWKTVLAHIFFCVDDLADAIQEPWVKHSGREDLIVGQPVTHGLRDGAQAVWGLFADRFDHCRFVWRAFDLDLVKAGQAALAAGKTRYTAARGLPELRDAIAGYYASRYGLDIDPRRILITPGGSGALLLATSLLVDPGKHWLLADPGYPCNRHFLRLVEGAAQLVPVGPDVRYQLTPELIASHWNEDSVGALVASPANPTGTLLHRDELAALSSSLKARDGHLVVDEIYHGLTYGTDAASVLEVDNDAFVLNSFSKYFGMTGWRLGWLVAPEVAVGDLEKLAQNLYISAPSMAQSAALACFEPQTLEILEQRRAEFGKRMTGSGPYADMLRQRFHLARRKRGLTGSPPPLDCSLFAVPPQAGDQLSLFG